MKEHSPVEPQPVASSVEQGTAARKLCPDPQLGTREGWQWCGDCGGIQPPGHTHDPGESADELRGQRDRARQELHAHRVFVNDIDRDDRDHNRRLYEQEQTRAEFAESLLCAMALTHGFEMLGLMEVGEWDRFNCEPESGCVFCKAAR